MTEPSYVYVIVRKDLPHPHEVVQSVHAAIAARDLIPPDIEHPHLVVCAVNCEQDLAICHNELKRDGVPHRAYHEPDFGGRMTAIATLPVQGKGRSRFRKFRLLK